MGKNQQKTKQEQLSGKGYDHRHLIEVDCRHLWVRQKFYFIRKAQLLTHLFIFQIYFAKMESRKMC